LRFDVAAQLQNIAALAHSDGKSDGGFSVDPEHRLRWIGIGATHLRNVAQPDQPSVRQEIDRENVLLGAKSPGYLEEEFLVARLDRARRADSVLCLKGGNQRRAIYAEASELPRRKFDENLLVLRTEDFNARHVRNMQQARANVLDIVAQFAMGEPLRREAVD